MFLWFPKEKGKCVYVCTYTHFKKKNIHISLFLLETIGKSVYVHTYTHFPFSFGNHPKEKGKCGNVYMYVHVYILTGVRLKADDVYVYVNTCVSS